MKNLIISLLVVVVSISTTSISFAKDEVKYLKNWEQEITETSSNELLALAKVIYDIQKEGANFSYGELVRISEVEKYLRSELESREEKVKSNSQEGQEIGAALSALDMTDIHRSIILGTETLSLDKEIPE